MADLETSDLPETRKRGPDNRSRRINIWLTSDEKRHLAAIKKSRSDHHLLNTMRMAVYPLILKWLNERAPLGDRAVVLNPASCVKDDYWGTHEEVLNPRQLPLGFEHDPFRAPEHACQQFLDDIGFVHMRAIERYYNVPLDELAGAAIEWAYGKMAEDR